MRILHLRSSGAFLGAERVTIELSKHLVEMGFESIIGIPLELNTDIPELYYQAQENGIKAELFFCRHPYDLSVIKSIREYVINNKINIVHSHGYREDLYAYGVRKNTFIVATNHLWKRTTVKLKLYAAMDAWLLKRFDKVFAVSLPILEEMKKLNISENNLYLISNGIDIEKYKDVNCSDNIKSEFDISPHDLVMITISSLSKEKGINFAIHALSEAVTCNQNLHLIIVGEGEEKQSLTNLVAELSLEKHVTFAGRRKDIPQLLSIADIFLLPSTMEGLPMAMLEAMAAQKAIIASDVGDVASALTKGSGILINPGDIKALYQAIVQLAEDRDLLEKLGEQAYQSVLSKYSSQRMASDYANHYREFENHKSRNG